VFLTCESTVTPVFYRRILWNVVYYTLISFVDIRVKKSLPEKYQKRTEASLLTAVVSASLSTLTCYPLDTVRRQMQMRGTPYKTIMDAFPGKCYHFALLQKKIKKSLCSPTEKYGAHCISIRSSIIAI
jgi:hypothetical protein